MKSLLARRDQIVKKLEALGPSALFDRNAPPDSPGSCRGALVTVHSPARRPGRRRRYPKGEHPLPLRRFQPLSPGVVMACQPRHVLTRIAFAAALASVLPTGRGLAQERDRGKIPDKYKWNLADIYPSDEAWRAAKERLVAEIPEAEGFRGTLGSSATRLADALELLTRLNKEFARAYVYASMLSDQDTRVSKYQGMQQEMIQVGRATRRRGGLHRAGDPEDRPGDDRQVRGRGTAAEAVPALPRRHPAPPAAHQERRGGEAARRPRRSWPAVRRPSTASSRTPTSRIRR